jgi:CDP-diacylglycerol---glycerol-3-phosphate 3-phosphatidyltransferase
MDTTAVGAKVPVFLEAGVEDARASDATVKAIQSETRTWANLVTAARLAGGFVLFGVGWQTGKLRWALFGLLVYWVGDLLDGWLARKFHQETLFGAQMDILADRLQVILFYAAYLTSRPEKALAGILFLFEFAILDTYLSNQFMRWPVLSPNYFYMVDRLTWKWLWSMPAKAFNCGLVTLLLIGLPWQWPALVVTLVLIGIRLRFAHRMLVMTTSRLPAAPPVPSLETP